MSNFAFLLPEFPHVHEAALDAERHAGSNPTAAAFFAGKAVELAVKWAFRDDPGLKAPYGDAIAALLHEPGFRRLAGEAVFAKARLVNSLRNRAVHEERAVRASDAAGAVEELFHVCLWLARTYAGRPAPPRRSGSTRNPSPGATTRSAPPSPTSRPSRPRWTRRGASCPRCSSTRPGSTPN